MVVPVPGAPGCVIGVRVWVHFTVGIRVGRVGVFLSFPRSPLGLSLVVTEQKVVEK